MVKVQIDSAHELQSAASLLFKNWQLAIPTAAASLIIGIFKVFFLGGVIGSAMLGATVGGGLGAVLAGLVAALPLLLLFIVLAFLLTIISQAVVVHASEDVWEGRGVDLARSFSVALSRLGPLVVASLLVLLAMVIPIALSVVVIGFLLIIVVGFFLMYTVPAVVLGNESGTGALGESYRIARENVAPSLFALLGIVVAAIIGGIIQALFERNQWLSLIASLVVGGFVSAYVALVVARFYTLLRAQTPLPIPPA